MKNCFDIIDVQCISSGAWRFVCNFLPAGKKIDGVDPAQPGSIIYLGEIFHHFDPVWNLKN